MEEKKRLEELARQREEEERRAEEEARRKEEEEERRKEEEKKRRKEKEKVCWIILQASFLSHFSTGQTRGCSEGGSSAHQEAEGRTAER